MLATMLTLLSSVVLMGLLRQFTRNRSRLRQADPYGRAPHHIPLSAQKTGYNRRHLARSKSNIPHRIPGLSWLLRRASVLQQTVTGASQVPRESLHTARHSGPGTWLQLQPQNAVRVGGRRHDHPVQDHKAEPAVIGGIPHQHDTSPPI